jgi:hypothetical protein
MSDTKFSRATARPVRFLYNLWEFFGTVLVNERWSLCMTARSVEARGSTLIKRPSHWRTSCLGNNMFSSLACKADGSSLIGIITFREVVIECLPLLAGRTCRQCFGAKWVDPPRKRGYRLEADQVCWSSQYSRVADFQTTQGNWIEVWRVRWKQIRRRNTELLDFFIVATRDWLNLWAYLWHRSIDGRQHYNHGAVSRNIRNHEQRQLP